MIQLDNELTSTKLLLTEKSKQIEELIETRDGLEEILSQRYEEKYQKQENIIHSLKSEVVRLKQDNEEQTLQIEESSRSISELVKSSSALQHSIQTLQKEKAQLIDENSLYRRDAEKYKNEVRHFSGDADTSSGSRRGLEGGLTSPGKRGSPKKSDGKPFHFIPMIEFLVSLATALSCLFTLCHYCFYY